MISKDFRCIFIHIQKTGGTSIEKKLGHFSVLKRDVQDHRTLSDFELITNRKFHLRKSLYALKKGKAASFLTYLNNCISPELTKKEFDEFFKFTFVRNSWSRMYSWYLNVLRDPQHQKSYGIHNVELNFSNFLEHHVDHSTFSQLHFIQNSKGDIPIDFIGRFEHLQKDFDTVCKTLKINDSELPKLLIGNNKPYTDFYNDRTKDLVYQYYKEEIDFFKFEFGE